MSTDTALDEKNELTIEPAERADLRDNAITTRSSQVAGGQLAATPQNSPESLLALAIQKNMPVEAIEKVMLLVREERAHRAKAAFDAAMAAFQADCPVIEKKRKVMEKNSATKVRYLYAPLEDIIEEVKPHLAKNGLSYRFIVTDETTVLDSFDDRGAPIKYPVESMVTTCVASHVLGHSETSSFRVKVEKSGRMSPTQEGGSANSFAKRYSFCNVFGIVCAKEDDDGAGGASDPDPQEQNKQATNGRQPTQPAQPTQAAAPKQPTQQQPPAGEQKVPTQKLGGDAKAEERKSMTAEQVKKLEEHHVSLWGKLLEADREPAYKIANVLLAASGPKGNAENLLTYRNEFHNRRLNDAVVEYLEAVWWFCWNDRTPNPKNYNPPQKWVLPH